MIKECYRRYIKYNQFIYVRYIGFSIVLWILGIITPLIKGTIIDAITEFNKSILIESTFFFSSIIIVKFVVNYVQDRSRLVAYLNLNYYFNCEILHAVSLESIGTVGENKTELFQKNYKDIGVVCTFLLDTLVACSQNVLTVIVIGFWIMSYNKKIFFIMATNCFVYLLIYIILKKKLYKGYADIKIYFSKYTSLILQQYINHKFIKSNVLEQKCKQILSKTYNEYTMKRLKLQNLDYLFNGTSVLISFMCQVMLYILGGFMVINNQLSLGSLTVMICYLDTFLAATSSFYNIAKKYQDAASSYDNLKKYSEYIHQDKNNDIKITDIGNINKIIVHNLEFGFEGKKIIHKFSAEFVKGNTYCFVGKNGIGKTTLLNIIAGLYNDNYNGQIKFNNYDIRYIDLYRIRMEHIGIVEQEPVMLFESVKDNIIIRGDETSFCYTGLNSYDNVKITNANNLSGGEKQKIAIVRQCLEKFDVLMLDEPSSMLDRRIKVQLIHLLQNMKKNKIIFIISHDIDIIKTCDFCINLEEDMPHAIRTEKYFEKL